MPLTADRVRELFSYEPRYGILVRMEDGDTLDGSQITIYGISYPTANVVWLYHYGVWPSKETKEEAHQAYCKAAKEHFGEFAYYDC